MLLFVSEVQVRDSSVFQMFLCTSFFILDQVWLEQPWEHWTNPLLRNQRSCGGGGHGTVRHLLPTPEHRCEIFKRILKFSSLLI